MSTTNDGKYLEDAVQKFFDDENRIDWACERLPDTRAARNKIRAQNADFLCATREKGAFYLECKSVKGYVPTLKMFRQYPLMRRWAQAGIPGYVLVHFYELDELFLVDVKNLPDGRSWNLKKAFHAVKYSGPGRNFEDIKSILLSLIEGD